MSQTTATPDMDGNGDLFNAAYRAAFARAAETRQPIEVILCQLIYQAAYELLLSDFPSELINGVVELAITKVAYDSERVDAEWGDQ